MSLELKKYLSENDSKLLAIASKHGLSVKSVKTVGGHDGGGYDSANLYVNNKKQGFFEDNTWGGGFEYENEEVFKEVCDTVIEEAGTYYCDLFKEDRKYDMDDIVDLLVENKKLSLKCKKNTMIYAKVGEHGGKALFTYPNIWREKDVEFYENDLKQDGFTEYEITNRRFTA